MKRVSFIPKDGDESEGCPNFPRDSPVSKRCEALETLPLPGLEVYVRRSEAFVSFMTFKVLLVGGFNPALRRLAPSEPVAKSSAGISYSSGGATPFFSFLSKVIPSVARLASRRETLLSKLRGADTGR